MNEEEYEYRFYCWMDEFGNTENIYADWMEYEGGWFPVYRKFYVEKKDVEK